MSILVKQFNATSGLPECIVTIANQHKHDETTVFWFKAFDVARCIGISELDMAIHIKLESEFITTWDKLQKDLVDPFSIQLEPYTTFITELGLYVLYAHFPEMLHLMKWVHNVVLPPLRRDFARYKVLKDNNNLQRRVLMTTESMSQLKQQLLSNKSTICALKSEIKAMQTNLDQAYLDIEGKQNQIITTQTDLHQAREETRRIQHLVDIGRHTNEKTKCRLNYIINMLREILHENKNLTICSDGNQTRIVSNYNSQNISFGYVHNYGTNRQLALPGYTNQEGVSLNYNVDVEDTNV